MLGVLLDKIIELGIDAGLECCSSLAHDKDFDHTYKETVENSLHRYWDRFNISSLDTVIRFFAHMECIFFDTMAMVS